MRHKKGLAELLYVEILFNGDLLRTLCGKFSFLNTERIYFPPEDNLLLRKIKIFIRMHIYIYIYIYICSIVKPDIKAQDLNDTAYPYFMMLLAFSIYLK